MPPYIPLTIREASERFEAQDITSEDLDSQLCDIEPFDGIELKYPIVNAEFASRHGERFPKTPDLFG